MILLFFIKIGLFGIVLCDVSEIINPSRDFQSNTGSGLLVTSASSPVISDSAPLLHEYIAAPSSSAFNNIGQISRFEVNRGDTEVLTPSPKSIFTAATQSRHTQTPIVAKLLQSESQYEQKPYEEAASTKQEVSENDPFIRINASELSDAFDGEISELPSELVEVSASTPETLLSEDGYHYSIPLQSVVR